MSRLDLHITFDRPEPVFSAGEEVSGVVELRSAGGAEIRGVTLTVEWRTAGKGNTDKGTRVELPLAGVPPRLARGERRRLPFRFTAPDGPMSYRGRNLKVVNVVRGVADVPRARDAGAEVEFELRPAPGQSDAFQGPRVDAAVLEKAAGLRFDPHPGLPARLGFAAVAAATSITALVLSGAAADAAAAVLIWAAALATLTGTGLAVFRSRIAERRLGRVEAVVDRAVVRPGEAIRVALTFQAAADGRLRGGTARLEAVETAVSGAGNNRATHRHKAVDVTAPLTGGRELRAGRRFTLWAPLELPPDAPFTFAATSNKLEWKLEVRLDLPGWPDWVRSRPILVRPAPLPAGARQPAGA